MNRPTCIETCLTLCVLVLIAALLLWLCVGCAGQNLVINLGRGSSHGGNPEKVISTETVADVARAATIPVSALPAGVADVAPVVLEAVE